MTTPLEQAHEGAERAAFNAGYCYGVENDASPEDLDCAWELYCRDRREQVRAALAAAPPLPTETNVSTLTADGVAFEKYSPLEDVEDAAAIEDARIVEELISKGYSVLGAMAYAKSRRACTVISFEEVSDTLPTETGEEEVEAVNQVLDPLLPARELLVDTSLEMTPDNLECPTKDAT